MKMAETFTNSVKYITDSKGVQQEVILPIKLWEKMVDELEALKEKQNILLGIESACKEVKKAISEKPPEQTLEDFLNEL